MIRLHLKPSQAGYTRFTYPGGIGGWVDLGGWVHTVIHLSSNRAQCQLTMLIAAVAWWAVRWYKLSYWAASAEKIKNNKFERYDQRTNKNISLIFMPGPRPMGHQNLLGPARLGPPTFRPGPACLFNEMRMTSCLFFCYASVCSRPSLVIILRARRPRIAY